MNDPMGDSTMPGPEHFREPLDARPQDIDGRSDRPGLGATLAQAADLLLEVTGAFPVPPGEESPTDGAHAGRWALECAKALMTAGWSAPSERTIGIPNGLVLHEEQWQDLANDRSTWVILPGGEKAIQLITNQSESPPSAFVRDALWELRENAHDPTRGSSTWDQHGLRDVTVPRSFLGFIVMLAAEFRRAGDYAAANSLDNALATIAPQLREAKIPWSDGGGATPASAPPMQSNDELTRLHNDIITVLRYVSMGLSRARSAPNLYPDFFARRALGTIELQDAPVGTDTHDHPLPWWSPLRASAGTPAKPIGTKPVEDMTIAEVQQLITDFEARYPRLSRVGTGPDTAVTRSAEETADSQHDPWFFRRELQLAQRELEKIKREGVPGVMHEVDAAFHKLVITERDAAWIESANRQRRIEELEAELAELRAQVNSPGRHDGDA